MSMLYIYCRPKKRHFLKMHFTFFGCNQLWLGSKFNQLLATCMCVPGEIWKYRYSFGEITDTCDS